MFRQSRVALGLAMLALLGGLAAIYVPAMHFTSDIDRILQEEEALVADALKERLLSDAEEDARALAILADARGIEGLQAAGSAMREAVRVNAVIIADITGRPVQTFAAIDTPGGISRTPAVRSIAQQSVTHNGRSVTSGFIRAYGQTYVTAATRLASPLADGTPAVVIVLTRIEQAVMARLSEDYSLTNLDLAHAAPEKGSSAVPLYDARGRVTGYLTWQASSPAQMLLGQLGPWVGGVLVAVAMILILLGVMTLRAHHRASAATMANQVLEKADRAKSLLFANLSHEFRTPLNAVIGFSDLMRSETMGPIGNRKYAEYIGDIHSSASHLLGLIEDVLVLSRYDASEGVTLNDTVRLAGVIEETCRMLEHQAAKKNLRLVIDPAGALSVKCTEKAVRQIVTNLVNNAIKYTEQGQIRVSAIPSEDGGSIDLVVADTGIGIPKEHLDRITRPFEQVDDVYARKQGGTGLGLSIVTSIVEHAGARMKLESAPGKGTRVTVTFRRDDDAPAAARTSARQQQAA